MPAPKIIAANWKMNSRKMAANALAKAVAAGTAGTGAEVVICPSNVHLRCAGLGIAGSHVKLGAQDCSFREDGAFTGDVSAAQLRDVGCSYVIVGHSERREYHCEGDELISKKVAAAHRAGLITIVCVGERDIDLADDVRLANVAIQLRNSLPACANALNTVIAYEPVWAIGSGKTPSAKQIEAMHKAIHARLPEGMRVLYGGSVKAENAAEILKLPGVDGALVGGASLDAEAFKQIVAAA